MNDGIEGVAATRAGRVQVESFYAYEGSLTTPGCTQDVRWSVLADGGGVSHTAVTRFHEVIAQFPNYHGHPNNNRPLQPSTDGASGFAAAEKTTDGHRETGQRLIGRWPHSHPFRMWAFC
jgi:hypothetical protein